MRSLAVSHIRLAVLTALLMLLFRGDVRGTTFVMMPVEDLARSSAVIALGEVQSISSQSGSPGAIETLVSVAVEERIKGKPATVLTMAIPGGAAGAVRRVVFGTPQFFLGERVIVFLRQRRDGLFVPNGMAMGKFTVVHRSGGDVARRQLAAGSTAVLAYDKERGELLQAAGSDERPLADFLYHLRQIVARQPQKPPRRAAAAAQLSDQVSDAFTFLGPPPARWIEPDSGVAVGYSVDPTGDYTLGPGPSLAAVHDAMAAWNGAGSALRLMDAGVATPAPFRACDGKNTIQFNDPFDEIGAPVNCGGILAIGGFCSTSSSTSTVNGTTFVRITEGDVTINEGFAGCAFWTATNLAEVLTHELGHTIGLAHSSENPSEANPVLASATMYYLAHFDGRGASLRSDDMAGVRALYPSAQPPPNQNAVRLRSFTIDGGGLVLNAIIRFPSDVVFHPASDSVTIQLQDSGGTVYSGTVGARSLRRATRRMTYAGVVSSDNGAGMIMFSWMRGGAATVVLRVQGAQFPVAGSGPASLLFQFGGHRFIKQLNLQPSGGGSWVSA
jgi:hypothetical protein